MTGGIITGNRTISSGNGGGVNITSSGIFAKSGDSVITGNDLADGNRARVNGGNAVWLNSSPSQRRESTVGSGEDLGWDGTTLTGIWN
jgi:hypothetical protein